MVGIAAFKNHAALWFLQGSLLKENTSLLYNAQEEKNAAMRQIQFEKVEAINTEILEKYILEAVQNQREGKKVQRIPAGTPKVPSELQKTLKKDREVDLAFRTLSPGKQREYSQYISEAKKVSTKTSRLEKIIPLIREGRGLNDKYKR